MKKILCDKPHRWPNLIKIIGITPLTLLMLMSIAGAEPIDHGDHPLPNSNAINPIALVYRGPAGGPGLSEAAAALLKSDTNQNFNNDNVIYVGPKEKYSVQAGLRLPGVVLYVQPGGVGTLNQAYSKVKKDAPAIRNFVSNGGRYLGLCMGGYMVDNDPGYGLGLNTNQYIITQDAVVKTPVDTVIPVFWRETMRYMYFQDGPYFIPDSSGKGQIIIATYTNGLVSAMVQSYGNGKIGVSGMHPEALASWYEAYGLYDPDGLDAAQGHDLIDTLMQ